MHWLTMSRRWIQSDCFEDLIRSDSIIEKNKAPELGRVHRRSLGWFEVLYSNRPFLQDPTRCHSRPIASTSTRDGDHCLARMNVDLLGCSSRLHSGILLRRFQSDSATDSMTPGPANSISMQQTDIGFLHPTNDCPSVRVL